jgi:hypothetical protein
VGALSSPADGAAAESLRIERTVADHDFAVYQPHPDACLVEPDRYWINHDDSRAHLGLEACGGADALPGLRPHHVQRDRIGSWDQWRKNPAGELSIDPVEPIRLGSAMLPRNGNARRVDDISFDASGPQPTR